MFPKLASTTVVNTVLPPNHEMSMPINILVRMDEENKEFFLRAGQLEAIQSIIEQKDTLIKIPTGGGKSVIYNSGCSSQSRSYCSHRAFKIYN